jgi:hypothetical protein
MGPHSTVCIPLSHLAGQGRRSRCQSRNGRITRANHKPKHTGQANHQQTQVNLWGHALPATYCQPCTSQPTLQRPSQCVGHLAALGQSDAHGPTLHQRLRVWCTNMAETAAAPTLLIATTAACGPGQQGKTTLHGIYVHHNACWWRATTAAGIVASWQWAHTTSRWECAPTHPRSPVFIWVEPR